MIISRSIADSRWRRQGLGRGGQDNVYDIIYTYTCITYVIHCTRIPQALDHLHAREILRLQLYTTLHRSSDPYDLPPTAPHTKQPFPRSDR